MEDLIALFSGVDYKIRKLIQANEQLRRERSVLEIKLQEQELVINNQKHKITELENKVNVLKISTGLASEKDNSKAKKAINELIKDIDKCISFLDKENHG